MRPCAECQELLLDLLYDLLEGEVREQLEAHLADCPQCQSALETAKRQQKLLAHAARLAVDPFKLQIPQETEEPVTLAFTPRESKRAGWHRWAAAAMLILTLGIPAWLSWDFLSARSKIREHEQVHASLHLQLTDANQNLKKLDERRSATLKTIDELRAARQFMLKLSGPVNYQPGASNKFDIETINANGDKVPARILAVRALDESKRVVFEETDIESKGRHEISLPADLPLKPGKDLSLEVVALREGSKNVVREAIPLAAPVYVTHLTTDKPIYQPGDAIRFRSLTLDRFTHKPADEPLRLIYKLQGPDDKEPKKILSGGNAVVTRDRKKKDKSVAVVLGPDGKAIRGIGGGEHLLGLDVKKGSWTLTVEEANQLFPSTSYTFKVRDYRSRQLATTIQFDQAEHKPGQPIRVTGEARHLKSREAIQGAPVVATLSVDGTERARTTATTDEQGKVRFILPSPKKIQGNALLTLSFRYDGRDEEVSREVALVRNRVKVDFYPEGGELIAGVTNRVYFQMSDDEVSLSGRLLDGATPVADLRTVPGDESALNQGRGVFTFTPRVGGDYRFVFDEPKKMRVEANLPRVLDSGVVLHIPNAVTTSYEPIKVALRNVGPRRSLLVGAYCRGRLFAHRSVEAQADATMSLTLAPSKDEAETMGGVTRITVFEQMKPGEARPPLKPLAERLVFRQPRKKLYLSLDHERRSMSEKVTIQAKDENQQATPALVMVRALDRRLSQLADKSRAQSMPTHFYLTSELLPRQIEHADFFLTNHPRASKALDLLLGTQGWRRFIKQKGKDLHPDGNGIVEQTIFVASAENHQEAERWGHQQREKALLMLAVEQETLETNRDHLVEELQQAKEAPFYLAALAKHEKYRAIMDRLPKLWLIAGVVVAVILIVILSRAILGRGMSLSMVGTSLACLLLVLGGAIFLGIGQKTTGDGGQIASIPKPDKKDIDTLAGPHDGKKNKEEGGEAVDQIPPGGAGAELPQPKSGGKGSKPVEEGGDLVKGKPTRPVKTESSSIDEEHAMRSLSPRATRPSSREVAKAQKDLAEWRKRAEKLSPTMKFDTKPRRGGARIMRPSAVPGGMTGGAGFGGSQPGAPPSLPGGGGAIPGKRLATKPDAPLFIRQHALKKLGKKLEKDFTQTVFWHPVLILPKGKAQIEFPWTPGSMGYSITVFGHTLDGRLGATTLKTTVTK